MFIGHWAPALVAATHPKAPRLGTLFVAAQLVDWGFFALLLTGAERMRVTPGITRMNPMDLYHMPWTHSLVGSTLWAAAFAALLFVVTRNRTAALIGGAVVLSHWFLDLLVHTRDLTLWGSPPKLGLGLWNHPAIEMPLELGITIGALLWFVARTRATGRGGRMAPAILLSALLAVQAVNWFGPVESEVTAGTSILAFVAYGLITAIAWWAGHSRTRPA